MSEIQSLKSEISKSIKRRDFTELDNLWLRYVEQNDLDVLFLKHCADILAEQGNIPQLTTLFELLIEEYSEDKNIAGILETTRILSVHKAIPNSIKSPLLTAIRKIYKSSGNLEKYILFSGLEISDNLQDSFTKLDDFLFCDIGQVFQHNTWGIGVVKDLDLVQQQVILNLEKKGEHRFTFSGAKQFLTKIPDDHFYAQKKKNPDIIKQMVNDQPLELVKLIAISYVGKITVNDLKKLLQDGFMTEDSWAKWWAKTKVLLKRDAFIDFTEGVKGEIQLRSEPKELHDELIEKFNDTESIENKIDILKEFAKHSQAISNANEIASQLAQNLIESCEGTEKQDIVRKLMYFYAYEILKKSVTADLPVFPVSENQLISSINDISEILSSLPSGEYQIRMINLWIRKNPDTWTDTAVAILPRSNPKIAEELIDKLSTAGLKDKVKSGINQLLVNKENNPETYLWLVQQILHGTWEYTVESISHYELVLELADLMESLQNKKSMTEQDKKIKSSILSKIRKLIEVHEFQLVRDIILDLPVEDALHLRNSLLRNSALNDVYKTSLEYAISRVRPDLEKQDKKSGGVHKTRSIHYCTREIYQQKTDEYKQICTIELHEVGRALAVARAHGDLRENSEYQSAKQKQRILMKQADELHDLLDRARVIESNQISTDHVAFGTRVTVINETLQKQEQYTILGIWEASPDKGIISYLSPLGASFLGKKTGASIEIILPEGKVLYKIMKIKNALHEDKN